MKMFIFKSCCESYPKFQYQKSLARLSLNLTIIVLPIPPLNIHIHSNRLGLRDVLKKGAPRDNQCTSCHKEISRFFWFSNSCPYYNTSIIKKLMVRTENISRNLRIYFFFFNKVKLTSYSWLNYLSLKRGAFTRFWKGDAIYCFLLGQCSATDLKIRISEKLTSFFQSSV